MTPTEKSICHTTPKPSKNFFKPWENHKNNCKIETIRQSFYLELELDEELDPENDAEKITDMTNTIRLPMTVRVNN